MEKSCVSMEQHFCVVCAKLFDTGSILLDPRLRKSMDRHTVTGFSLCPDCEQKELDGYIALVELVNIPRAGQNPSEWDRTGNIAHVKRDAWEKVFNTPPPIGSIAHLKAGCIERLEAMLSARPEQTNTETL